MDSFLVAGHSKEKPCSVCKVFTYHPVGCLESFELQQGHSKGWCSNKVVSLGRLSNQRMWGMRLSGQIEGVKKRKTNIYHYLPFFEWPPPTDIISDILIYSVILSDILPDIFSYILSDILADIYSDILSGTYLAFYLTFYLTYLLSFYLAFYLTFIWHIFWHSIRQFTSAAFGARDCVPEPARMLGSILAEGRGEEETRRRWGGEVRSCACSNLETFTWQVGN